MSIFTKWFTKTETEVPDLEEIVIEPEIIIPEPTTRALYEAAVQEVQLKRIQYLILAGLYRKATDPEVYKQTLEAITVFGEGRKRDEEVALILEEYPKANLNECAYYDAEAGLKVLQLPKVTIEDLSYELAKEYLSE